MRERGLWSEDAGERMLVVVVIALDPGRKVI